MENNNNKKMNWTIFISRIVIGLFVAMVLTWSAWVSHVSWATSEDVVCVKTELRYIRESLSKIEKHTENTDQKLGEIKLRIAGIEHGLNGKRK